MIRAETLSFTVRVWLARLYLQYVCVLQHGGEKEKDETKNKKEDGQATTPGREHESTKKAPKEQSKLNKGRTVCRYMYILVAGIAILLVYIGNQWLSQPAVNRRLPLIPAVSSEWRNESEYGSRLWGTYRCVQVGRKDMPSGSP